VSGGLILEKNRSRYLSNSKTDSICPFLSRKPAIGKNVFLASNATILGAVSIGDYSSVFYGAVLRGDINSISIGSYSNIQDGSTLHVSSSLGVVVGNKVTVGHNAIIHGATIQDSVLIGMGAIVLDGVHINSYSIVAAGALLPKGIHYPPNSLIVGSPARVVRQVTDDEKAQIDQSANKYAIVQRHHANLS